MKTMKAKDAVLNYKRTFFFAGFFFFFAAYERRRFGGGNSKRGARVTITTSGTENDCRVIIRVVHRAQKSVSASLS